MFPLLVLGVAAYLYFRAQAEQETVIAPPSVPKPGPIPMAPTIQPSSGKEALLPDLSGAYFPDWLGSSSAGKPYVTPWIPPWLPWQPPPELPPVGIPGTEVLSLDELKTPRSLPAGAQIQETAGGAEAPMYNGERVKFRVELPGTGVLGVLEGVYAGPSDPSTGHAYVYVDRTADVGTMNLPVGRYTLPASKKSGWHTYAERIHWYVLDPAEVGLQPFAVAPGLEIGDKITLAVRDLSGTQVVAIASVYRVTPKGELEALLLYPYKVLKDEGAHPVVFPKHHAQALVKTRVANLVDPKSMG